TARDVPVRSRPERSTLVVAVRLVHAALGRLLALVDLRLVPVASGLVGLVAGLLDAFLGLVRAPPLPGLARQFAWGVAYTRDRSPVPGMGGSPPPYPRGACLPRTPAGT